MQNENDNFLKPISELPEYLLENEWNRNQIEESDFYIELHSFAKGEGYLKIKEAEKIGVMVGHIPLTGVGYRFYKNNED